mmetsp:Transcript_161399/g.512840  ORF Transcript_161399/g.512840 Transcript_161399/m.512840 type:complete len:520 (+) Transcript_161399:26-1585(+)
MVRVRPPPQLDLPPLTGIVIGHQREAWAATARADEFADLLQLRKPSYCRMFQASFLGLVFLTAGLLLLGFGERGDFGTHLASVLALRVAAWMCIYFIPVHCIAIANLRDLISLGEEPLCNPLAWAQDHGGYPCMFSPVAHGLCLLVYVGLTCVPVHQEHGHFGYVVIYGVGHLVIIASLQVIYSHAPSLRLKHLSYAQRAAAPTIGIATMGFFVVVTGFALLKRHLGPWFSSSMVLSLFLYENLGTIAISRFYINEFLKNAGVRDAYRGTPHALVPSSVIALLCFMADGARITMLITSAAIHPDDDGHFVALGLTFVVRTLSRTGCFDALLVVRTSLDDLANTRLLLRLCRSQSGYPRFFALFAVGAARFALGHHVSPNHMVTQVVWLTLLETVIEDLVVSVLQRCGFVFEPSRMRRGQGHVPTMTRRRVVGEEPPRDAERSDLNEDAELFEVGFGPFPELPFWSHFSTIMISQFHTVLLIIIFGGGVHSVLGFCGSGYTGIDRGIVWWPDEVASSVCN